MRSNYVNSVREFAKAFGHPLDVKEPSIELIELRRKLIKEEFFELEDALFMWSVGLETDGVSNQNKFRTEVAKELADLLYVVFGAAETFDIDLDVVFNRVHNSNMSKLGEDGKPIYREDGKVMKGPNYKPPFLEDLV